MNSHKFRAIILNRQRNEESCKLRIDYNDIRTTTSIKLLGINIDDELKFNEHQFSAQKP